MFSNLWKILFPIFINKWPAASVHLNRKLYQEICSTYHISPFNFMLRTINRCNTEARCHKWWWWHHGTCWEQRQQSSDGYVERPFCFMCQKRHGWPRHAWWRNVSLCSSSNAKREKTRLHNSSSCTLFMPLLTWSFPLKDTKNRFYEGEQLLLFL